MSYVVSGNAQLQNAESSSEVSQIRETEVLVASGISDSAEVWNVKTATTKKKARKDNS